MFRAALCWLASSLAWTWAKVSSGTIGGTGTSIQSSGGRGAWLIPGPAGSIADLRCRAGATRVRLVSARPAYAGFRSIQRTLAAFQRGWPLRVATPSSVSRRASRYTVAPGSRYQSNSCATSTASPGSTRTAAASRGRSGSSR